MVLDLDWQGAWQVAELLACWLALISVLGQILFWLIISSGTIYLSILSPWRKLISPCWCKEGHLLILFFFQYGNDGSWDFFEDKDQMQNAKPLLKTKQ